MKSIPFIFILFTFFSFGQSDSAKISSFELGIRCKKFVGFYWENGISGEFKFNEMGKNKLSFGFNVVSSKLGSGITGYEIPTIAIEGSIIKYFRDSKKLKPLIRLNIGYAHANYGSDIFGLIPSSSALLSLESGISYTLSNSFRLAATGGYNFINGNGSRGLGTVYPFFGQFSVFYKLK